MSDLKINDEHRVILKCSLIDLIQNSIKIGFLKKWDLENLIDYYYENCNEE